MVCLRLPLKDILTKNSIVNEFKALGRQPTFSPDMEKILCEHILKFEETFFGLTISDIRKLAFDIAEKYSLPHTFNKEKGMAGKKWFYNFMRGNKKLSLRKPEQTSFRASGIWPVNRNIFRDSDFASADALVPSVEMPATLSTTIIGLHEGVSTSAATQSNEITNRQIASTNTNSSDRSTITASASPKSSTATGPASTSLITPPSKTPERTDELKNVLHDISPLPKPNPQPEKLGKRKRRQELAQKAAVISSSPYKLHLEESKVKTGSEK
jgi:hypothetical protein